MPQRNKRKPSGTPATLFIRLDRSQPLAEQLAERIRKSVKEKRLLPGTRLPSLRTMAGELEVSVDTVLDAYRLLADEGWVQAKRGAGFFVCEGNNAGKSARIEESRTETVITASRCPSAAILEKTERVREQMVPEQRSFTRTPLTTYASGMNCIAEKHFLRFAAQLARSPWLHRSYSDPQGYLPLRHAICRRLLKTQGVRVRPEQVVVTSGFVQSLSLLAEILFEPGDSIWLEDPGYATMYEVFHFRNKTTCPVPVDQQGFNIEKALEANPQAKGVCLSPASQYPLGTPLADDRAAALLDWARRNDGWIIEDGTDGAISLGGSPYRSLLERAGNSETVAYVESFSLLISPSFRVGYIVLPEAFAEVCTAAKYLSDRGSTESSQALLAEFLDSDSYDSFVRRLNRRYRQRFDLLRTAAEESLRPYGKLCPALFGCRAALELNVPVDDKTLCADLARDGILLQPLSVHCRGNTKMNGLILGFGTLSESEIRCGVKKIAEYCENHSH